MIICKEELLHIANLARLEIEESEIENYLVNLQDILDFANTIENAPVESLDITVGSVNAKNRFRKDIVNEFEDTESLLAGAKEIEQNMIKLPKVLS